jgi:multidrug transporter EmrE-like cation transporter
MYVAGMPFMAITAFIIEPIENFAIDLSGFGVWTIAYAVIAQSIIAYFLLAYANSNMESSIVAAFGPINPLSATIAAVILLGEAIGPQEVIGSLIILGGLALVTYQRHLESLAQKALAAETPVTVAVESVAESTTTEATDSATNDGSDEANDTDDPEVSGDESNMVQLDEFTLSNPSSPTPLLAHDGAHHKELHAVVAAERDFEEKSTPQGAHS